MLTAGCLEAVDRSNEEVKAERKCACSEHQFATNKSDLGSFLLDPVCFKI